MSLFKRSATNAQPPSMESKSAHKEKLAQAAAAELEALEADEVRRPLVASKRSSPPQQSSIAVAAASFGVKKKRESIEVRSPVVPPPIPPRNGSLLGGRQQKPPGIVFSACYDDSSVIGRILSKVENLSSEFTLLFTRAGLTITLLDTSHVTLLAVNVPAESFLQYANLQSKPISFTVNSKAWCRFAKTCQSDRTLTFVYDQCTLDSEPLHLMLFPPSGSGQSSYRRLSPMATDDGIVQPNSEYQYEVCVSSRQFFKNVANLGTEDDTVRLRLSAAAFELAALSPGGEQIAFHSIPVSDAPSDGYCTIKRIGSAVSDADLAQFANFRMSAVYLLSACAFGNNSECDWLTLRFGVTVGEGGECVEEPLYLRFPVRQGSEKGAFDVQLWVAPKLGDTD